MNSVINIHPAFVHFPIALFFLYAVMEIARLSVLTKYSWWDTVKKGLLFLGVPFAYLTIITGGLAEEAFAGSALGNVVAMHETFAWTTAIIFTVIAAVYLFAYRRSPWAEKLAGTWLIPVLALVGLICLFVVGSLGASIVYGPSVDPVVKFIYGVLFPA